MARIIETKRLLLRPLLDNDAVQIAEKINVYEISKNLARVPYPYHYSDAVEFLAWVKTLDRKSLFRVITLKENPSELLGMISIEWSEQKQDAEIGYWLVESQWGKGVMTEAATAMIAEAFEHRGVGKIISCFFNENPASGKVLTKAGFEITGQCRHFSKAQNQEVPVTTVALTRTRWLSIQAQKT
jgi:RimJ/RimL family protein N-acetyltransferase